MRRYLGLWVARAVSSRSPVSTGSLRPLRREGDFLRLVVAGIASVGGSSVANVAVVWLVFSTTGSALDVGLVAVSSTLASIVTALPAGVWVDRHDRRRLMILSDVVRAAAVGGLALSLWVLGFALPLVVAVSAVVGGATVIFNPAEQSLLPTLVGAERLADANAWVRSSRDTVSLIGTSGGGILVVVIGAAGALALNAATFGVSAVLVSLVFVPRAAGRDSPLATVGGRPMSVEIVEGLRWLRNSAGLFQLALSATGMNFFATMAETFAVVYTTQHLGGGPIVYGAFLGTLSIGSVTGAFLVGRTGATGRAGKVWLLCYGGLGGAMLTVLGFAPSAWVAVPAVFVFGVGASYAGSTWLTTAQKVVPTEMQGRYFAVDGLLSWIVLPGAQVAGAIAVAAVGISTTYVLAGLGLLAVAGGFSLGARALWSLRVATEPATAASGPGG